ncbi:MAG: cupin domain-containing protein [Pirellulaceae bacterium]|nr:cupin domain-containing protein [Pirellulaceae bacterium]
MPNLFANLPESLPDELTHTLLQGSHVRIERIVSTGHATGPHDWYDQEEAEWVVVLKGAARLEFEDQAEAVKLLPGDWINITPHRKHRVDWTSADEPTVWLAVFYRDEES